MGTTPTSPAAPTRANPASRPAPAGAILPAGLASSAWPGPHWPGRYGAAVPPRVPPGRPVRVAIDATPLLDRQTGIGRFVAESVRRLAHRSDTVVTAYGYPIRSRHRMRTVVPPGVRLARLPMAGRPMRAVWRRTGLPPIEVWTGRVDVVHGPNFVVPPALPGTPEVVTVHDLTVVRFPELCNADTLQFPAMIRRAVDRGAWVHTVSRFVADEVIDELGVAPDRVVVIPNGVDPTVVGDPAAGRAMAGAARYVLALGTVEPRKDLPSLVRAFDLLAADDPDLALAIVGPDGWGAEQLAAAIGASPHRSRIRRIGWVSDEHRGDLLRGASALAYPSLYEGFGLPPLEAMAAGVPVVTTRAGAVPEVVGDAALLVDVGEVDALADALRQVLIDPALADELRRRGRDRVARYPWDRTAAQLAGLYHRLAGLPLPADADPPVAI